MAKPKQKQKFKPFMAVWALVSLSAGLLLTGGGYALYNLAQKNGLFLLKQVEVEGHHHLDRQQILGHLGIELGVPLLDVPVLEYKQALLKQPWVRSVRVSRRPPGTLKIIIQEKKPLTLSFLSLGEGNRRWYGLTREGRTLPDVSPQMFNLPVLESDPNLDSSQVNGLMTLLETAKDRYPGLFNAISQIQYQAKGEFVFYTRDNGLKVVVSTELEPESTLEFWDLFLKQHGGRLQAGASIDLRVEGNAYVT